MDEQDTQSRHALSEVLTTTPVTRRQVLRRAAGAGAGLLVPGIWQAASAGEAFGGGLAPTPGGRLRTGHVGGGTNEQLDPNALFAFIDAARSIQLFDGLTALGPNNSLQYRLAESMEPNKTATQWKITLRKGVTFHNGKELTADDLLYNWSYILNPKLNVPQANAGIFNVIDPKRSKKINKHTVLAVLTHPMGYLPFLLATPWPWGVFPAGTTRSDFRKHPIGTGPFKFVSWTPGQQSLFAKNENYWVTGRPYVDELQMISIPDAGARLNALLTGQIDAMETPELVQVQTANSNSALQIVKSPSSGFVGFTMRLDTPPFTDNRVRQAFRYAIDRPKTIAVADLGYGSLGNDIYGKGFPSYNSSLPQIHYDPQRAKALLKKAGHENLSITVFTSTVGPGMTESAIAFSQQARAAGINVKIRKVAADSYFDSKQYYLKEPLYQTYWNAGAFETIAQLSAGSGAKNSEIGWDSKSWDARFKRASGILDPARRYGAFKELQRELWNITGYILWSFVDNVDLASSKVHGIVPSQWAPMGSYDFKSWYLQ